MGSRAAYLPASFFLAMTPRRGPLRVRAFVCVRWLLRYIASHDFTVFAWYRILFGALVLISAYTGLVDWSAG